MVVQIIMSGGGEYFGQVVMLWLVDGMEYFEKGILIVVEFYVNEIIGVVMLWLFFDNLQCILLLGMYVQVVVQQVIVQGVIFVLQEGVSCDWCGLLVVMVVNV